MTVVVPDALADIRYWLRHHPDLAPLHSGRVFFRIPDQPGGWPLQRLYRTGGSILATGGDTPAQELTVSIEAWHNTPAGYTTLRQLVAATESAMFTLPAGTQINPSGHTVVLDAAVTNVIDTPDPETGWPRFVCDCRVFVQPL